MVVQFHKSAAHSLEHAKLACFDLMNRTDTLVKDVNNYDILRHTGDLSHANGYMSEWDQFQEQVADITACVPYMVTKYVKHAHIDYVSWKSL